MHFCYILFDNNNNYYTYNGYTNNVQRRIRQHNGEIKGGAKYTSKSKWSYFIIIHSEDFTYKTALSFEWHVKYPNNKRPRPNIFNGIKGRLDGIALVLKNEKFAHLKTIDIFIQSDLRDYAENVIQDDRVNFQSISMIH
jgi:predicted GIY-YIG superfamily endonuclease